LHLVLEIDRHIDGYIDAYTGPVILQDEVTARKKRTAAALLDDLHRLQEKIPQDDPQRAAYLTAVLRAIECTLHLLGGEEIPYREEVARIYDIRPEPVDEAVFQEAHRELDTLLPGAGALADRLEARRKRYYLAEEKILPMLLLARNEARQRTLDLMELPADNGVEIDLAEDQPWGAYNWFLGDGRSLIQFNTDNPISALGLIGTFAHEGYPGHHTEHLLKEQKFVHEKGYGEMAAALLHSPSAVIAEGIATTAVEIIFPEESRHAWTRDVLLPAAGIETEETAEEMARISRAARSLRYVGGAAALLHHTGQLTAAETVDYLQEYGLRSPKRAAKGLEFITHPLFRPYIFTYTQGYDLIEQAAADGDKLPVFRRLLEEQILPSQLKTINN
jgi:hypothetical protein